VNVWPNWVDLLIVTVIFRACYTGFARGLLGEFFHCIGAVSVTCLTVNYAKFITAWLRTWMTWADPTVSAFVIFWVFFLGLSLAVRVLLKFVTRFVKWERVHWLIQGVAIALGGLRGLWWAGFLTIVFVSSGFTYLQASVEERSVLGPRLLIVSREYLERTADLFPGAEHRNKTFVPPLKQTAK